MIRLTACVLATLAAAQAVVAAQPVPDAFDEFYDKLIDSTIETRTAQQKKIESARKRARSYEIAVQEPTISTAGASTASELAQAAINTSVQGADAGITVSPLALFGRGADPFQISTTLATLKGGVTRVVLAASYQFPFEQDLDIDACKPVDANAVRTEALKIHDGYRQTCEAIVTLGQLPPVPEAANQARAQRMLEGAIAACGPGPLQPRTVSTGQTALQYAVTQLVTLYSPVAAGANKALQPKLAALVSAVGLLMMTKASFVECHGADELADAAIRTAWEAHVVKVGFSFREDRAAKIFGLNPDPKTPLADGRLNDGELRAELTYTHRRVQATLGGGIGEARISLTDPLIKYWSPSLSIAVALGGVTGDPLIKNRHVNVVNGALPPRLVVGLDALVHYSFSPPATYSSLEKVAVTAYFDFRFTDKLSFRVGAPLTADLVTRKADNTATPPTPAQHDLQWTIPIFVATVIKL